MKPGPFILITAAKNEDAYIGETIRSVLRQSIHPVAWFIMDDGSTDRTAEIVAEFAREHRFILLQSAGSRGGRNFGSQYKAIQAAFELAKSMRFDFIGVHDADISPAGNDYFERLLGEFLANPKMGLGGGYIYERQNGEWRGRKGNSEDSVAGGIQMFRRACFEQIGGYVPLVYGGSDWLAQIDVRLAGWDAKAFPSLPAHHYRPTGTGNGMLRGLFRMGMMDASFGSAFVFQSLKCFRRMANPPWVLGAGVRFAGYLWWRITGRAPLIAQEKVAFLRQTQMAKIKAWTRPGGRVPPARISA